MPGVTDGFTKTASKALLLVTLENSKFNGVLLPLRGAKQPGMLTQETPPKPKLVGALLAPLIVTAKVLKLSGANVLAAILTLTVVGAAFTVKLCKTGVAAAYVPLPACEAVIVQVPVRRKVAVLPETAQTLETELAALDPKAPHVGIVMGSKGDMELMQAAADELQSRGIAHEMQVMSAHRDPNKVAEYSANARERGLRVIMQMPPGVPVACVGLNNARNAAILAAQILAA